MKSIKDDGSEPGSARNFNPSNDDPPEDDGMVACQHCGRKFNDTAAARHIPICQKVFSNKGAKPRGGAAPAPQKTSAPAQKASAKPAPAPARRR
jgi:hypothetical protein